MDEEERKVDLVKANDADDFISSLIKNKTAGMMRKSLGRTILCSQVEKYDKRSIDGSLASVQILRWNLRLQKSK